MTANFSLKRLGQLIGKQWTEHRRMYIMSALALLGLLGIVFAIWLATGGTRYNEEITMVIGLFGLFITGVIFASTTFSMLGSKDKGIYWISFPASHLEKFLAALFFNVIVFSVVYFLCFLLLKTLAGSYIETLIAKEPLRYSYKTIDWTRDEGLTEIVPNFICLFFVVQATFILGSVAFKRFAFVITTVLIAAFLFCFIFYVSKIVTKTFPGYDFNLFSLQEPFVNGMSSYKEYMLSPFLKESIIFFLKFLITPLLWLVTWVKLKEKQI